MKTPRLAGTDLGTVARIEAFTLAAVPARTVWEVPGWWCVADDGGYVGRTNSATAVPVPDGATPASLDTVAASYRDRGFPPRIRWTPLAPAALERQALAGGWVATGEVIVMLSDIAGSPARGSESRADVAGPVGRTDQTSSVTVSCPADPDPGWVEVYLAANADGSGPARLRLAAAAPQPRAYATITVDGVTAAIGLGVVRDGLLGIFDVVTAPPFRRTGLARRVMAALRGWGGAQGAGQAFLQVHGGNAAAIALYHSLGFTTGYTYLYLAPS